MLLLPAVNLLEHGLPDEVSDSIEVIVTVNHTHQVVVVTPFDPARDGDFREDLLPRLR